MVPATAVRVRGLVAGGCGFVNGRRAAAAARRGRPERPQLAVRLRLQARTRYYLVILCSTYTTLKKASKVLKKCNSATIQLLIAGFYLNHISLYAYKPTNHVYYATPDRTTHQVIHGKFTLV